jgi:dipeptidyl aminopeptidase/acylaminoacyl peptidase
MRLFAALLLLPLSLAAQKHPIAHKDVWQMKRVGAPAVSPDGKWAVVPVTEPSYDPSKTSSDLWIVPLDGSAAPRRLTTVGASYGGYLMNWFEGNTHRFKCLVNHAGLIDNASFRGATDGSYYWQRRNGGPVWEQQGAWREQSPSAYAANFATPMLITHGEQDFRVPINQAFEIYKLLQRRQVPCRLLIFPDASHWVLRGEDARSI